MSNAAFTNSITHKLMGGGSGMALKLICGRMDTFTYVYNTPPPNNFAGGEVEKVHPKFAPPPTRASNNGNNDATS